MLLFQIKLMLARLMLEGCPELLATRDFQLLTLAGDRLLRCYSSRELRPSEGGAELLVRGDDVAFTELCIACWTIAYDDASIEVVVEVRMTLAEPLALPENRSADWCDHTHLESVRLKLDQMRPHLESETDSVAGVSRDGTWTAAQGAFAAVFASRSTPLQQAQNKIERLLRLVHTWMQQHIAKQAFTQQPQLQPQLQPVRHLEDVCPSSRDSYEHFARVEREGTKAHAFITKLDGRRITPVHLGELTRGEYPCVVGAAIGITEAGKLAPAQDKTCSAWYSVDRISEWTSKAGDESHFHVHLLSSTAPSKPTCP